jgi:signal peptidase II
MNNNSKKQSKYFFIWIILVILCDQLTKWWVISSLSGHSELPIIGYLNIILHYNTGVSFGFLAGIEGGNIAILLINCCIIIGLSIWGYRQCVTLMRYAAVMIIGGGVGNLMDRVMHKGVVDFIDLHYSEWHYPAFNVADASICVGVVLMIISLFKHCEVSGGKRI